MFHHGERLASQIESKHSMNTQPTSTKVLLLLGFSTLQYSGKPNTAKALRKLIEATSDSYTQQVLARQNVANIHRYKPLEKLPFIGQRLPYWEAKSIQALSNTLEAGVPGTGVLLEQHLLPRIRQGVIRDLEQHAIHLGGSQKPYIPKTLLPKRLFVCLTLSHQKMMSRPLENIIQRAT
jgi:hypothetical protein